jgi:hypothetical protein
MKICNNSDSTFQLSVFINNNAASVRLAPRERTSSEELFRCVQGEIPRYFHVDIRQDGKEVQIMPSVENNTYLGLVVTRKGPEAKISFEPDDSKEAQEPTDEMVRIVAQRCQKMYNDQGISRSSKLQFNHFVCYNADLVINCQMRIAQAENAFKKINGIPQDENIHLSSYDRL